MSIAAIRIFIYTILPLLIACSLIHIDKSICTRERKLETFLVYLFSLGVAGSGIAGFAGHLFFSDLVAEFIGWPVGNPFQLEVGFANLALGALGLIASGRRDGFREATVIAVSVFALGATVVHIVDFIQTDNLAPGNSLQNISNLLKPALLVSFLVACRRAEQSPGSECRETAFKVWHKPMVKSAGTMTMVVSIGFGVGFSISQPTIGTGLGILVGSIITIFITTRRSGETGTDRGPAV